MEPRNPALVELAQIRRILEKCRALMQRRAVLIRVAADRGHPYRKIAAAAGVSHQYVAKVVKRQPSSRVRAP